MDNTIPIQYRTQTSPKYVKQEWYVDDKGLYVPCQAYVLEGLASDYEKIISKEQFVEMYNKWIKGEWNE
jgi:hypothetical protein